MGISDFDRRANRHLVRLAARRGLLGRADVPPQLVEDVVADDAFADVAEPTVTDRELAIFQRVAAARRGVN